MHLVRTAYRVQPIALSALSDLLVHQLLLGQSHARVLVTLHRRAQLPVAFALLVGIVQRQASRFCVPLGPTLWLVNQHVRLALQAFLALRPSEIPGHRVYQGTSPLEMLRTARPAQQRCSV